jgi:hypothetical protein
MKPILAESSTGGVIRHGTKTKRRFLGIVERGGNVRAWHIKKEGKFASITGKIKENVSVEAELLITDESRLYSHISDHGYKHATIQHSAGKYVEGNIYTNGIENFWSLFKRGVIGSFHKVSVKHLDRYLAEFCFRFSNRRNEEMFAMTILALVIAAKMPYAQLIGKASEPEPSEDAPF